MKMIATGVLLALLVIIKTAHASENKNQIELYREVIFRNEIKPLFDAAAITGTAVGCGLRDSHWSTAIIRGLDVKAQGSASELWLSKSPKNIVQYERHLHSIENALEIEEHRAGFDLKHSVCLGLESHLESLNILDIIGMNENSK